MSSQQTPQQKVIALALAGLRADGDGMAVLLNDLPDDEVRNACGLALMNLCSAFRSILTDQAWTEAIAGLQALAAEHAHTPRPDRRKPVLNYTLPAATREALAKTMADLEAEQAARPALPTPDTPTPVQEVQAKPAGHYTYASAEERHAALRALGIHHHGHALGNGRG
ncbi:hypothetical protein HFP71_16905 [Streptomyces sp. ARC32]